MAKLGVQPHVIEALVNHLSGHKAGVAGIYNRAVYAAEKREAASVWTDHIDRIVMANWNSCDDGGEKLYEETK